jgi:hypothetical protein
MNENLTEKEQNNTFIKQTSFISSIDPNITTNHTFRIIKKRMPWSEEEDKSIKTLVSKYGTGNWTLISNEMGQNRSGKQCRERWYNQLKPNVKKNNWTNEEENILFTKHMQFGNKWSDIASFLPGRTLNDIKNHFYSKLRKFIRKILKQINDENLFKINGIDGCKYTGEKIYKMIKKHEITYKNLTKDTIFELIIATEKNPKGKFIFCNDFSNNDFNSYNYINNINNNFFDNNNINRDGNYNNQISYNNYLEISQEINEINDKLLNEQNNNIINREEMMNDKIKKEKIVNYKDKNNIKKTKINKINNNKIDQLHNNNHSNSSKKNKKKSDINIQYNLEKKLKEDNGNNNNKLIGQKRKKNSSNKKNKSNDKNNHIGNNNLNYIFELNNKSKKNKYHQNQINKNLLLPNEMSENNNNICLKDKNKKKHFRIGNKNNEKSKDIIPKEKENKENNNTLILQSKTENKDNNNNFCFYPPFKVVTPKTSKHIQYPLSETKSYKSLKPEDFSFNYYDSSQMPQMFPANIENLLFNSQKNKNIFVTDLSFDNNLLKSRGSCLGSIKNDNTYKNFSLDGNLYNKLIMQSNMNMNNSINNNNNTIKSLDDNNLLEEKNDINIKKNDKPTINLDLINHQDFTNTFINGNMTGGNESQYNSIFNKNNPLNIYNSSPSSLKSLWK